MYFNDLLAKLTFLTKRNNLSNTEIGTVINVERRAINGRAERNSKFKDDEIDKIEKYYNVTLSNASIIENSLKMSNNIQIIEKTLKFNDRLINLQKQSGLTDKEFSKLVEIDVDEYREFKKGERKPNFQFLISLKQHFKISIDWLLFGE